MTVIEVALALNISQQRVRMLEKHALAKVKAAFLALDCKENWLEILTCAREKDPYNQYLENNHNL